MDSKTSNGLLAHLVAEAVALGGGNLCASGHDWGTDGGRPCECGGSQVVYRCKRCGDYDYGDKGGPAYADCLATNFNCGC